MGGGDQRKGRKKMDGGTLKRQEGCGQAGFTQGIHKAPETKVLSMELACTTYFWRQRSQKTRGLRSDWWLFSLYIELRGCPCPQRNDARIGGLSAQKTLKGSWVSILNVRKMRQRSWQTEKALLGPLGALTFPRDEG